MTVRCQGWGALPGCRPSAAVFLDPSILLLGVCCTITSTSKTPRPCLALHACLPLCMHLPLLTIPSSPVLQ
jgi:hypothetical protein